MFSNLLLDEASKPVAVQIDYADWIEIARRLGIEPKTGESVALQRFEGTIALTEDPKIFQEQVRREWR